MRDRVVERLSRDPVARLDEPSELRGRDGAGLVPRADDAVRDHVRGRDAVRAGRDRLPPEPVEAPGHQHERALEVERSLDLADPLRRERRERGPERVDERRRRLDRDQIGIGEVAVVVCLLLRAPCREPVVGDVVVVGVLLHLAARLPDLDLAGDLGVDALCDVS